MLLQIFAEEIKHKNDPSTMRYSGRLIHIKNDALIAVAHESKNVMDMADWITSTLEEKASGIVKIEVNCNSRYSSINRVDENYFENIVKLYNKFNQGPKE